MFDLNKTQIFYEILNFILEKLVTFWHTNRQGL